MKILVGYIGKNIGKDLLDLAVQHTKAFNGKVLIATSLSADKASRKEVEETEKNLADIKQLFEEQQLPCETHLLIRSLSAGEDIVQFAKEQMVDEIIIGVKSRSKVGKLLFGSTAQYVILKAHCPVVTVK